MTNILTGKAAFGCPRKVAGSLPQRDEPAGKKVRRVMGQLEITPHGVRMRWRKSSWIVVILETLSLKRVSACRRELACMLPRPPGGDRKTPQGDPPGRFHMVGVIFAGKINSPTQGFGSKRDALAITLSMGGTSWIGGCTKGSTSGSFGNECAECYS